MTNEKLLEKLGAKLDAQIPALSRLDQYYSGTQPLSFLAPEAREALGNRLRCMSVNVCRQAVSALSDRLRVVGFKSSVEGAHEALWRAWEGSDADQVQDLVHRDVLALGRAYVAVWAGPDGLPVITPESAHEMAVLRHPVTREIQAALKRWVDVENVGHAVLYLPDRISRYTNNSGTTVVPASGWTFVESLPNPLGRVPIVEFLNRGRLLDRDGVSEMTPILDLQDALNKVCADMLVSSEFFARPKRWVTGLEIHYDADGNAINPFPKDSLRMLQSESPDTEFGQFPASSLDPYRGVIQTLTQQIAALSGLPPTSLGLFGDQPASADAIRSAETPLVLKAIAKQRLFGRSWAATAALVAEVGGFGRGAVFEPLWASAETRTPAQQADAAAKLVAAGILPVEAALRDLGYTPEDIADFDRMRMRAAFTSVVGKGNEA